MSAFVVVVRLVVEALHRGVPACAGASSLAGVVWSYQAVPASDLLCCPTSRNLAWRGMLLIA